MQEKRLSITVRPKVATYEYFYKRTKAYGLLQVQALLARVLDTVADDDLLEAVIDAQRKTEKASNS